MENIITINNFYLFTFNTTTNALKAEKVLKNNNAEFTIIPTLREISTSCGLSIKIRPETFTKINDILNDNKVPLANIYKVEKKGNDYLIQEVS